MNHAMSASTEHKHLAPRFSLVTLAQPLSHATLRSASYANMIRSPLNVRKKATDVSELAALIRTQGLLQNLVGYTQKMGGVETGIVEIVAGGRRLEAIGILIADGTLPEDLAIPYLLVTEDEAIEISMAENRGRENMHPADVYQAMLLLTERGRSIEDIAISFNLDTLTVKRCLKLANVAPRLLELYRNDQANFDQMMALAISDSHAAQEQAWDSLSDHTRYAHELRRLLTARQVNVQSDRLARYVGIEAFEKAGGEVVRDLFSDSGSGYISDVPLLESLAMNMLEKQRAKLLKEGFTWVEILPRADYAKLAEYGRVRTTLSDLTPEQAAQLEDIDVQIENIQEQIDAADDEDSEEYDVLCKRCQGLETERQSIVETRCTVPNPDDKSLAGAVVTLDDCGTVVIKRDFIRPADKVKMTKLPGEANKDGAVKRTKSVHSDRLTHILTSHRTVALQAELMDSPDVALVLLTHSLLIKIIQPHRSCGLIAKVSLTQPSLAGETKDTLAQTAFAARRQEVVEQLPKDVDSNGLLLWLHQQPQIAVLRLMAFCAACSLDATQSRESPSPAFADLAGLLNLDMTKWWTATAANYFNHVSRDRTVAVVVQAVSREAAVPVEKMRKAEATMAAERAMSATSWLPELLRIK